MRIAFLSGLLVSTAAALPAAPRVDFTPSATSVASYDSVEVTLRVSGHGSLNPFADARVTGTFQAEGGAATSIEGFCDAADGSIHRIRFMPSQPGNYSYTVVYRQGAEEVTHRGAFVASDSGGKGMLRVDPEFPKHLQWTGSLERFFWNGISGDGLHTAEVGALRQKIESLDRARITGIRLVLDGGVWATDSSPDKPAFHLATWQACERLLTAARERDMVVALKLDRETIDDAHLVRYAVARLGAFRNLVWDLPEGAWSTRPDPYGHLTAAPGTVITPACASDASCEAANDEPECWSCVRRAWEVCLAGGYPTLGAAALGCASGDATCSDETLTKFEPLGHLYDFFTGVTWWEMRPHPELVVALHAHPSRKSDAGAAAPKVFSARNPEGDLAAIYVAGGGVVTVKDELLKDQLKPLWFSPRDGGMRNARALRSRVYRTPTADDWVLLFRTPCNCSFRDFDNEFED